MAQRPVKAWMGVGADRTIGYRTSTDEGVEVTIRARRRAGVTVDERIRGRLKRLSERISEHAIQEVPPGLYACEICRRTECSQDEWIVCENRVAHAKCLEEHQPEIPGRASAAKT